MGINNSHCNVANKKIEMKILTIVWGIIIVLCVLEAIFCTKFDKYER